MDCRTQIILVSASDSLGHLFDCFCASIQMEELRARAICNAEGSLALRAAKGEDEREVHLQSDGFRCAMASSIERVLRRGLGLTAEKNK